MKTLLMITLTVAVLFSAGDMALSQPLKGSETLRQENVLLPAVTPDKSKLTVRDRQVLREPGGAAGILVFYDEPRSNLPVDYVEFYDLAGNLLLIGWIDASGVCQAAMDRGLLDPRKSALTGVFVMISLGTEL